MKDMDTVRLIERIREVPEAYLGVGDSIFLDFVNFCVGYDLCQNLHGKFESKDLLYPGEINQFVAKEINIDCGTPCAVTMITQNTKSSEEAFNLYCDLRVKFQVELLK